MRILIIYASAGAGHRMAAQAIYNSLKGQSGVEATLADVLDFTPTYFKFLYSQGYIFAISRLAAAWAFFFWLLDQPFLQPLVRFFRRIQNGMNARRFEQYLEKEQFDWVISTHFMPNEIAAYLKTWGRIRSKILCAVTDFDVHHIWLAKGIDAYTVACDWTKEKMEMLGVLPQRLHAVGIPTDVKFSRPRDIAALRQGLGLKMGVFTVLVATGSFGIGPMAEIIEALKGFQVMVVCGHNKKLFEELKDRQSPTVKIFGLVSNMDELMAAADAMITKPGGLSISEALVSQLPMIFFSAIPGQETNNIKVLKSYGVGLSGCTIPQMATTLREWQAQPEALARLKENIRALAKPSAVVDIISMLK